MLGPVEAVREGTPVDLGAPQLRALLARLLLSAGQTVPADVLLDALWEDRDDASVRNLRVYVSRLRKVLGDDVVRTRAPGYILHVEVDQVDSLRFERMVAEGRQLLSQGSAAAAAQVLRSALALWHGPALADQRDRAFAHGDAVRLDNARLDALEERIEADLACGRHNELSSELRGLVATHPLRERLWRQRMVAEHRAGQTPQALRTYQELRQLLADELGLDPSPSAQQLERAILSNDLSLDWHPPIGPATAEPAAPDLDPDAIRVLIVDDHPLWRTALREMLERHGAITVVGEAEDGITAVATALEVNPDVVLMDLHLPGLTGAEATAKIVQASPGIRILMLSASGDEADVLDAVRAGASGYLLKSGEANEVIDGIVRANRGEPVFTSSLAGVMLDRVRRDGEAAGLHLKLSVAQRELLRRMASGASLPEVAATTGVDLDTARRQMAEIVNQLQAVDRGSTSGRRLQAVLFVDVVDSTPRLVDAGDRAWRELIGRFQAELAVAVTASGGRVVKHIGDGALLTFDQPRQALSCIRALAKALGDLRISVRAGAHLGECEVEDDDVHGLAVVVAARVMDQASPGEVLVSHTVRDLVMGSEERFEDRGSRRLKGVPGSWRLYALAP